MEDVKRHLWEATYVEDWGHYYPSATKEKTDYVLTSTPDVSAVVKELDNACGCQSRVKDVVRATYLGQVRNWDTFAGMKKVVGL